MRAPVQGMAGALFLSALWVPTTNAAHERADRGPRDVVYDLAVSSYCGLITPEVEAGYHREVTAVTTRAGLSEAEAKAERIAGWVDADREWANRGLGGYRGWCETEGLAAARHLRNIARKAP